MTLFYITKYALSIGVFTINSSMSQHGLVKDTRSKTSWAHFSQREAFTDRDAAIFDSKVRRTRKIASLRKQIAKLEALDLDNI